MTACLSRFFLPLKLETERLILKPVTVSDAKVLQRIFADEFVRKYLFDGEILESWQTAEFIALNDETFRGKKYGLWLIYSKETNEAMGFTGLWHFFDEIQPQLLYALLPEFTGKGFAAEAARKIIEYAFFELSFDYIDASCDAPNVESQRVAERLGMKKIKEATINKLPTVFFRLEK